MFVLLHLQCLFQSGTCESSESIMWDLSALYVAWYEISLPSWSVPVMKYLFSRKSALYKAVQRLGVKTSER